MHFNTKALGKIVSFILIITGIAMLPSIVVALFYQEATWLSFVLSASVSIVGGSLGLFICSGTVQALRIREAYLSVMLCWIVCSVLGSFPYLLSGAASSFVDAFFEAVSGYTTTGASVLGEPTLFKSLVFWKATTHWLGGMGILIFIISILPSFGVGSQRIAAAEAPGPGFNKTSSKMSDLARNLYLIYLALTGVVFMFLVFSPMSAFDALVNAMGCISTSGLILHPGGIAYYDSLYIEMVISLFTVFAAINFVLYIHLAQKNFSDLKNNVEIRVFLVLIIIVTILVTSILFLNGTYSSFGESLRYGFFQVVSFATTTGYSLADYTGWPTMAIGLLFSLLFIGGCAASTSGSIKVIRVIVVFKLVARGFYKRIHPRAVRSVRVGHNNISSPIVNSIATFVILYFATFLIGSLVLSLQNLDLETTFSATAALLSSTGIAFGEIGGSGDFSCFTSPVLRFFMTILMIMGRLELFTVFLLFLPSFWDPDKAGSNK